MKKLLSAHLQKKTDNRLNTNNLILLVGIIIINLFMTIGFIYYFLYLQWINFLSTSVCFYFINANIFLKIKYKCAEQFLSQQFSFIGSWTHVVYVFYPMSFTLFFKGIPRPDFDSGAMNREFNAMTFMNWEQLDKQLVNIKLIFSGDLIRIFRYIDILAANYTNWKSSKS